MRNALRPHGGSEILTFHDYLSEGPLAPIDDPSEWRARREEFWRFSGSTIDDDDGLDPNERIERDHDLIRRAAVVADAEQVVVWAGSNSAEQILVAAMPALLGALGGCAERLMFVQLGDRFGDATRVSSVATASAVELVAHPAPRQLSSGELELCRAAWRALTAPEPDELVRLATDATPSVFRLRAALRRQILRYPDEKAGLGCYEELLLRNVVNHGPKAVRVIAHSMVEGGDNLGELVGDGWLFWRLRRLAAPSCVEPLVTLAGADPSQMRGTDVFLTEVGRRVLDGKANHVHLNGIDDWVAGVHLSSKERRVWFRREDLGFGR